MQKILNYITKFSIYALVFLMPLFWLPWTVEAYEFNKQYLLVGLVSITLLAWLAKMIFLRKKISILKTPLNIFILIFTVIIALSAVFSVDSVSSWLGFYGKFSDSAIGMIAMALLFFVIVNNTGKQSRWVINLFLVSACIAMIMAYFSIFGIWSSFSNLPRVMSLKSFNPTSASLEGLAVFLAVVVSLLTGLLLSFKFGIKNIFYSILLIFSVVLLCLINFWVAWVILAVSMVFALVVVFWTRIVERQVNLLAIPIVLLAICIVYFFNIIEFLPFNAYMKDLPKELILSHEVGGEITLKTLKTYPILGSGPSTFWFNFNEFKPISLNQGEFWNIRFDTVPSHLMAVATNTGVLGVISYLFIVVFFFLVVFVALRRIKKDEKEDNKEINGLIISLFLGWIALLSAQVIYYQNTVLSFCFWLFTGLIIGLWALRFKSSKLIFSFKRFPEIGLVANILFVIMFFGFFVMFFLGSQFYLAEVGYTQAVQKNSKDIMKDAEKVVNLNKYRENYRRLLSQVYLANAQNEANKSVEERDVQFLQNLTSSAVQQAKLATKLSPNSSIAWDNLGIIYRDMRGLVNGVEPFAEQAFAKASELEPLNPLFYRERCRMSLMSGEENWENIVSYCQQAVNLKPNYLDAHFELALVFEKKGDIAEAVRQMESVLNKMKGINFQRGSNLANAATEVYFQLGRLHFNLKNITQATKMFEQSVIINPQYPNTRFSLGMAYRSAGRLNEALNQFQITGDLLPGDEKVQAAIKQTAALIEAQKN